MLVVGIQHSTGDYNGYAYDNYKLHCLIPSDESKQQSGQLCEIVKVPKAIFDSSNITIGDEIVPLYDKFGRLVSIE